MALLARFFQNKIKDIFFRLIPIPSGTADALYVPVTNFFNKYNIDYKSNLIGFASDGGHSMMDIRNSLSLKLIFRLYL